MEIKVTQDFKDYTSDTMKDIIDFPGYAITNDGKVWSYKSNKWLPPQICRSYYYVHLYSRNMKCRNLRVHKLVAKAFVPGYFEGATVDHIDGNRFNNHFTNLQWLTEFENNSKGHKGKIAKKANGDFPFQRLTLEQVIEIKKALKDGVKQKILAEKYGVSFQQISRVKLGKTWSHIQI